MSADLFAVFGAPDTATAKEQHNGTWNVPKEETSVAHALQPRPSIPSSGDVLFDADQTEVEDDFGDFEDVAAADAQTTEQPLQQQLTAERKVASLTRQVDLLDLESDITPEPVQEHAQSSSIKHTANTTSTSEVDEWGDFEDFATDPQPEPKPAFQNTASHVPFSVSLGPAENISSSKGDDWDDFEVWNAGQTSAKDELSVDAPANKARHQVKLPDEPRPANIPPPTILLQLLVEVFHFLQDQAKTSYEAADVDETAASIVTVFAVSARIIAGRSLRWKRDTYLAQSTRIGPSTSGGRSGGMKLSAVNKAEAVREEREAADVCDTWSRNAHIFAGVVTRSEHRRPWMNLNIKMTPRPSPGFGTLEARDPCVLCGIRRDERIAGVDFDADDVFSEYWTEHWGHTDCKVFWYTYRDMLEHR